MGKTNTQSRAIIPITKAKENKIGRPEVVTPKTLADLKNAYLVGANDREACYYAGISPATLYNYQKDHPDFLEQKKGWKTDPILRAKNTISKKLDKLHVAQWYLEKKSKEFKPPRPGLGIKAEDGKIEVVITDYNQVYGKKDR